MPEDKHQETSEDLLRYAQAIQHLKGVFPETVCPCADTAKAISLAIKKRVTPPEQPGA